ncbi:MAG: CHAD domain-containing protein [Rhodomicrobiaceae bacterium]
MAFRLVPGQPIGHSVRQIGAEQIDRVLPKFSARSKNGNAIHETRKALKRLRALLNLIKPAMAKSDFRRREARLKLIARSLSSVRDIQTMPATVEKLAADDPVVGKGPVAAALMSDLEAKRKAAEKHFDSASLARTQKLLGQARRDVSSLHLDGDKDSIDTVTATLKRDYGKARRAFQHAYDSQTDEAFHEWRKYVQRHWRQLLLIAPSWPKAIRPQIALARDLAEALGEDHDIAVLAAFVAERAKSLGDQADVDAYLDLCRRRQAELRTRARDMGERLLAEKPSSLAARLRAYWRTAPRLGEGSEDEPEPSNVIALNR